MIHGFSLAPIGERPPPLCASGWADDTDQCGCYPRYRGSNTPIQVKRNSSFIASSAANIIAVSCPYYWPVVYGGDAPTSADAQIRPFIRNKNVFIHLIDGRVGHIITLILNITRINGAIEQHTVLLEITA